MGGSTHYLCPKGTKAVSSQRQRNKYLSFPAKEDHVKSNLLDDKPNCTIARPNQYKLYFIILMHSHFPFAIATPIRISKLVSLKKLQTRHHNLTRLPVFSICVIYIQVDTNNSQHHRTYSSPLHPYQDKIGTARSPRLFTAQDNRKTRIVSYQRGMYQSLSIRLHIPPYLQCDLTDIPSRMGPILRIL